MVMMQSAGMDSKAECSPHTNKPVVFLMFETKARQPRGQGTGQGWTNSRPRPRPDNLEAKAEVRPFRGQVEAYK